MRLLNRKKQQPVMENRFKPRVEEKPVSNTAEPKRPAEKQHRDQGNTVRGEQSDKQGSTFRVNPASAVRQLLDGSILTNDKVIRNIPFILFITGLAVLYIANSATAEKNTRDLNKMSDELKELRYMYISTKSSVMYLSNQSQISLRLKETGIKENIVPPVKIFIPKSNDQHPSASGR
jgi:hypothetical protein